MEVQPLFLGHHSGWCIQRSRYVPSTQHGSIVIPWQLLAYGVAHLAGIGGYNGWRWIFIIEGLATVCLAVVARFFIVDWPETSKFLNSEERQLLLRRLSEDAEEARMDHLDKKSSHRIFGDWKIYVGYVIYPSLTQGSTS